MDITQNLELFDDGLGKNTGRHADARSASFDYCFNHFQSFREEDKVQKLAEAGNMEMSCLQLGFYLASWGMLRGSSFLLEKSLRFYQPPISISHSLGALQLLIDEFGILTPTHTTTKISPFCWTAKT